MTAFRLAARGFLKRPGLTFTVVATLASGLAFNIATASIVSSLLRRPYPFPDLDRLVIIRDSRPRDGLHQRNPIASGDFTDLRRDAGAFSGMAAWRPAPLVVAGGGAAEPEAIQAVEVSASFFDVLGARASAGRTFLAGEDTAGRDAVVVFSRRVWHGRFGADPGLVGREVTLNGRPATVIGIVADDQGYPAGVDAWVPIVVTPADARERIVQRLSGVARVKPDATLDAAQDDVSRIAATLARTYPKSNRGRGFELLPLRREQYEFTAPLFLFLQAAALLVLAIGITNVSSLLLARTIERRHEVAVRMALGASCARLFFDGFVEAVTLTAAACVAGAGIAIWIVALIRAAVPEDIAKWIAGWSAIHLDAATAAAAVLLTVIAGLLLGVVAGAHAARVGASTLGAGGRGMAGSGGRLRRAVVAAQVCVAVMLLVGAAVALQGFRQMSAAFASLRPSQLLTVDVSLPHWQYPTDARVIEFEDRLMAVLDAMPPIESAGLIRNAPASNVPNPTIAFAVNRDAMPAASDAPRAELQVVTAGVFRTLGIAMLAGRAFGAEDTSTSPRAAIVSHTMARRFFRDRDPVGATLRIGLDTQAPGVRIVGVVSDVRLNWYDPQPQPVIYLPHTQSPARGMTLVLRTTGDSATVAPLVRAAVRGLDARQPIGAIERYTAVIDASLSPVRIIGILLIACGVVATALAAIGVNGALAHWVASRRREFGVRLALGADRSRVMRMVVFETLRVTVIGVAVGVPLAWAGTVAARTAVLGLPPVSAGVTVAIAVFAFVVAIVASLAPALRASRVDPARLLQAE